MSYASAVEPLRAANVLSGRELYRWRNITCDGEAARASNGAIIAADQSIAEECALDALFICAGGNPASYRRRSTFAWLRRLARGGVHLGGISGGPYLLARAGLLTGYRSTIHWEHMQALVEEFPDLRVTRTLYEIDRDRLTCAGGIAGLDMMIELVERDHGHALSVAVSEWFLRTQSRLGASSQRIALRERYGVSNDRLLNVLAAMEKRIEDPASRAELAEIAGISMRRLERLFVAHLKTTIGLLYLTLRLQRARQLLRQTSMRVVSVAMACGFASSSHFSRAYKAQYGVPPSREGRGKTLSRSP
jgi:transcriptional regulator GlxA family with amidase domain